MCDEFIYIENLTFDEADAAAVDSAAKDVQRATATQLKSDTSLVNLLRNAAEAASDEDGWAPLSAVGAILTKQRPDFDSRSYGYAKLSDLIEATTLFEMDRRSPGDGKQAVIYIRDKLRRSAGKGSAGKGSAGKGSAGKGSAAKSPAAKSPAAKSPAAKKTSGATGASAKAKA